MWVGNLDVRIEDKGEGNFVVHFVVLGGQEVFHSPDLRECQMFIAELMVRSKEKQDG